MYEVDTVVRDYLAVIEEKDNEIVSLTKENNALRLRHDDLQRQQNSSLSDNGILSAQSDSLREQVRSVLASMKQTEQRQTELELCLTDVATALSSSPYFALFDGSGITTTATGNTTFVLGRSGDESGGVSVTPGGCSDMSHLSVVISEAVSDMLTRYGEMVERLGGLQQATQTVFERAAHETSRIEGVLRAAIQEEEKVTRRLCEVQVFRLRAKELKLKEEVRGIISLINHEKKTPRSSRIDEVEDHDDDDDDDDLSSPPSPTVECKLKDLKTEVARYTSVHDDALKELRRNQVVLRHERSRITELKAASDALFLENEFLELVSHDYSHFTSLQLRALVRLNAETYQAYSDAQVAAEHKHGELESTREVLHEVKSTVKQFQRGSVEANKQHYREVEELQRETEQSRRSFEHENEQLKAKVVSLQTTQMQLRKKIATLSAQLEKSESHCVSIQNDLSKGQEQHHRLKHDRDVAASTAKRQAAVFESFQADTEAQLKALREQAHSGIHHVRTLQDELGRKTAEAEELCDALETAAAELESRQQRIQVLEKDFSESRLTIRKLETQLEHCEKAHNDAQVENASVKEKVQASARHVDELKMQLLRFNDRNIENGAEVERLRGELERAAESGKIETSIVSAELSMERKNCDKMKTDTIAKVKAWEDHCRKVGDENKRLVKKVGDLELACELSVRHINELREELCRRRAPR